jgi:hypothetical protein
MPLMICPVTRANVPLLIQLLGFKHGWSFGLMIGDR